MASELVNLPEDRGTLKAMVRSLALERDLEKQRAEELRVEMLRLQPELERFKKWYYGPRADRLASGGEVAQMLLAFAEEVDGKPVHPDDLPPAAEAADEPRRLRRSTGRRNLAHFEDLPVTTHVYELSVEERACPECERNGSGARIEAAAKPKPAIDKGLAGPGLLAYIVTSKFFDYLPLYRLEDIFERQGFEISRATQSIWCGDVADLVEPLYGLMADAYGGYNGVVAGNGRTRAERSLRPRRRPPRWFGRRWRWCVHSMRWSTGPRSCRRPGGSSCAGPNRRRCWRS